MWVDRVNYSNNDYETIGFRVVVEPSQDQNRDDNSATEIELNTEPKEIIEDYQEFVPPPEDNQTDLNQEEEAKEEVEDSMEK